MPKVPIRSPHHRHCRNCHNRRPAVLESPTTPTGEKAAPISSARKVSFEDAVSDDGTLASEFPTSSGLRSYSRALGYKEGESSTLPFGKRTHSDDNVCQSFDGRQRHGMSLRRVTPSVCLSSFDDTEATPDRCPLPLLEDFEERDKCPLSAWGHFVDVVPPESERFYEIHDSAQCLKCGTSMAMKAKAAFAPYEIPSPVSTAVAFQVPLERSRSRNMFSRKFRGQIRRKREDCQDSIELDPSSVRFDELALFSTADVEDALENMHM